ncbi:MAG: hypothetical protein AB1650_00505 [Candidatus Omnitrophota bacterium]
MKECPRCQITFHMDDRERCLYCNTILQSSDEDKTDLTKPVNSGFLGIAAAQSVIQKVVDDHGIKNLTRLQFIVSSYFRTRTLHFTYAFCRNDFLMGPVFRRRMIQPFNITSALMLPWVVFNLFDSVFCRFLYTRYCHKCGWKFYKVQNNNEHHHEECEYNREYKNLIEAILRGSIMWEEATFKRLGLMKKNAGRRSAYWELCEKKVFFSGALDIACIWFSICLWTLLIIGISFPYIIKAVYMLEV